MAVTGLRITEESAALDRAKGLGKGWQPHSLAGHWRHAGWQVVGPAALAQ